MSFFTRAKFSIELFLEIFKAVVMEKIENEYQNFNEKYVIFGNLMQKTSWLNLGSNLFFWK